MDLHGLRKLGRFALSTLGLVLLGTVPGSASDSQTVVLRPVTDAAPFSAPMIGANVHFGTNRVLGYFSPRVAERQLEEIGASTFRDYMPWQSFTYGPNGPVREKSQRLMNFLPVTKLQPLINLGLTNSFVPGGVPPLSDEGLALFRRYVVKAVQTTRDYDPIYEIWNEWNLAIGTGKRMAVLKAGDDADPRAPARYVRVSKAAVEEIRRTNPKARILVGAVGDDADWAWAREIVRLGALDGADGLSIHLYNQCARDKTAKEMVARATKLQDALTAARGAPVPIYVTEFGWPTNDGDCGMPFDVTAYSFAHFVLQASAMPWIKGIWMHELKNIGEDAADREHNYGLFFYDDKPKPAACYMAEATRIVRSADHFEVSEPMKNVFVARAVKGAVQTVVLWTSGPGMTAHYALPEKARSARAMCGDRFDPQATNTLGPQPMVFDFDASQSVTINFRN